MFNALQEVGQLLNNLGEHSTAQRVADLASGVNRPELQVVIFGEFNRGKSTLINALLGRLVLPAKLVPTTGHVTRLVFGANEQVRVRHTDGRLATCPLSQLAAFAVLDREGRARDDVAEIEVAVNCPMLREGLILIDTPGVNEQEAQTRRAREAVSGADLILLVVDARQLLGSRERELASDWLRRELGKPLVLVVNFLNLIDESGLPELQVRLDTWCHGHLGSELGRPWFAVNALAALKAGLGTCPAPADDFITLRDAIANCRGSRRRLLQQQSRRNQLLAEVRSIRGRNSEILEKIRDNATQVERERAEYRNRLQELRRRHSAAAAVCREHMTSVARQELDKNLESLISFWFRGESKDRLEANASRWYQERLFGAVRSIEKAADAALAELAGDVLRRPDPLTLSERALLDARIDVGDLPLLNASPQAIGLGVGIGAAAGTFLIPIPGVGTAAGAFVGGWLANLFGSTEPDYVTAYTAQVRPKWGEQSCEVLAALQGQLDARLNELQQQIDKRLQQVQARIRAEGRAHPLDAEIRQREALETALVRSQREVQAI
jgi:tRNA U34 5-carboxymethylaminomethyl modifying GTPase MnmE/TrmE